MGASWGLLGPSWGLLGPSLGRGARVLGSWSPSWALLGAVLGPSWAVLGASWAVLRLSWAVLGPSWGPLGPPWGGHGGLLGKFGASEARKGENPKNIEKTMKVNDFGIFGPSSVASWRPLGASWRSLGPSGGHLGRLKALCRCLGATRGPGGPSRRPIDAGSGSSWEHPGAPGSARE